MNGCIITPVAPKTPGAAGASLAPSGAAGPAADVELHEGPGWKLVLDKSGGSGSPYTALVGSDTWAIALTHDELVNFVQVCASPACPGSMQVPW